MTTAELELAKMDAGNSSTSATRKALLNHGVGDTFGNAAKEGALKVVLTKGKPVDNGEPGDFKLVCTFFVAPNIPLWNQIPILVRSRKRQQTVHRN